MGILFLLFSYGLFFTSVKCTIKQDWDPESKQPLPFFRRQVEEIYEDNSVENKQDEQRSKLIAFLIKNVKEVFKDTDINLLNEFAESLEQTTAEYVYNVTLSDFSFKDDSERATIFINDNNAIHAMSFLGGIPDNKKMNKVTKRDKLQVSRDLLFLGASPMLINDNIFELKNVTHSMVHLEELSTHYHVTNDQVQTSTPELKRSCIHCNNIAVPECASPKNKL